MIVDSRRVCEVLVGLGDVNILGVEDLEDQPLRIHIETRIDRPDCSNCDGQLWIKDRPMVELVDLACFGRPTRLVWRKRRWRCPNPVCSVGSFTESDSEIAGERSAMTTRAARWVTFQVGKNGRSVKEVAAELETDWHTVNNTVVAMGEQLLTSDASRVGTVHALGVDEVLFVRQGKWRAQLWSTQIVDVQNRQLLDVIPDRTAAGLCAWLGQQPVSWRNRIAWAALDLSGPWRNAFDTMLPHATQVADPFHVVKLANLRLDECRRRTQHETLGHRGRKHDPLYRSRRLLTGLPRYLVTVVV